MCPVRLIVYKYFWMPILGFCLGFACEDCICVRKDKPTWRLESCLREKNKPFWREEIDQRHCTSIGEWPVLKEIRNHWRTEQQTSNRSTKENNSSWWKKHCESCEEKPQHISQWHHQRSPQGRSEGLNQPFKEDLESRNIVAIPQDGWMTSGVDSPIFIDDVTHDGSSRMNSEVCKNILLANLRRNASKIGRNLFRNTLPTQQKTSLWRKNGRFLTDQVNLQTVIQSSTHFTWRGEKKNPKTNKRKMQQSGDVSGSQAWSGYCRIGICYK